MSNAPLKNEDYPKYFIQSKTLLAFTAKDKMFKIEPVGTNSNPGVAIDHYTTRNMVIKHYPGSRGNEVSKEEFSKVYEKLFKAYLTNITNG